MDAEKDAVRLSKKRPLDGILDTSAAKRQKSSESEEKYLLEQFLYSIDEETGESYDYSVFLRHDYQTHTCEGQCECPVPKPIKCADWKETKTYLDKYGIRFFADPEKMEKAMFSLARRKGLAVNSRTHVVSSIDFESDPSKVDDPFESWFIDVDVRFMDDSAQKDCIKSRLNLQMYDVPQRAWNEWLL